jgi:VanZ family protein
VGTASSGVSLRSALWALFSLFIVYGATIPFQFSGTLPIAAAKLRALPLNPFLSAATGQRVSIPDTVQNILLFLPFGVLGVLSAPARARRWRRVVMVTILGAALSVAVETLQLFTADRVSSLSDVATNTIGACLGAIAANSVGRLADSALYFARERGLTENTAFRPLLAVTLLVAVAAWEPFDVTLELGTVASKAHALARDVWQAGVLTDEGIAFIHYALFGVALSQWLEALGRPRVGLTSLAIGSLIALGLEASQIAITSRMPGLEDALVRAAGVALGVACWAGGARRVKTPVLLAAITAATAVAAAMQQLSPFDVAPSRRAFSLMPFLGDYEHTTFDALSHVLELLLLYAPLGFLYGTRMAPTRRALLAALVATLAIAWPVEWLQGWVVGRYPDLTDIAMSLAGAWLGVRTALVVSSQSPVIPGTIAR